MLEVLSCLGRLAGEMYGYSVYIYIYIYGCYLLKGKGKESKAEPNKGQGVYRADNSTHTVVFLLKRKQSSAEQSRGQGNHHAGGGDGVGKQGR